MCRSETGLTSASIDTLHFLICLENSVGSLKSSLNSRLPIPAIFEQVGIKYKLPPQIKGKDNCKFVSVRYQLLLFTYGFLHGFFLLFGYLDLMMSMIPIRIHDDAYLSVYFTRT